MAGLVSKIKADVKKAGTNKAKFAYIRDGEKRRYRFLTDADDGVDIKFHDSYADGVQPTPCQEIFGRDCPYCNQDGIRTRSQYAWSVWDYEEKEVKVFMFPVNNCSPVPQLVNFYENYGTICDRDYVISVTGKQQNKSFGVVPMDKVKFRNDRAKSFSQKQLLKMLDKAFPCDTDDRDDDNSEDDDNFPMPKPKTGQSKEQSYDSDKLPDAEELERLSAVKLYNMCKERDIDVKSKRDKSYYIDMLMDWRADNEEEEVDDYDSDQDWEDEGESEEKPDYSSMSAKELYKLCRERDIDVQPKKAAKYYIRQLEDYDKANDDWGDSGDEWEDDEPFK